MMKLRGDGEISSCIGLRWRCRPGTAADGGGDIHPINIVSNYIPSVSVFPGKQFYFWVQVQPVDWFFNQPIYFIRFF